MRRAVAYIFILLLGLNSFGLDQLFKLPTLISHYQEHTANGTADGVWDFLAMHYLGRDIADNDADRDSQLPFKSLDSHAFCTYIPASYPEQEFLHPVFSQRQQDTYYGRLYCDRAPSGLLRPPRCS